MKFLIVLAVAVIGAIAAPPVGDVDPVDRMQKAIERVLALIPEPLVNIQDKTSNVDLGFEQLDFTFNNVVVSGIKNLATTLSFDEDTGVFNFEFNWETIKADVEFDLILSGILNAVNHPVMSMVLTDSKFVGNCNIDTSGSPHQVTDLTYTFTLGGNQVSLKGLLNDDDLSEKLENLLNDQWTTIINNISTQIEPVIAPIAKSIINIILRATN